MRVKDLQVSQDLLAAEFSKWLREKYHRTIYFDRSLIHRAEAGDSIERETAVRLSEFVASRVEKAAFKEILPVHLRAQPNTHNGEKRAPEQLSDRSGPIVVRIKKTVLKTNTSNPQWADYRELDLRGGMLRDLSAVLHTSSPYFRFGFKLRTPGARLFGDGGVKSSLDVNVVVHIGRNKFSRNLFLTSYRSGIREAPDKALFEVPDSLAVPITVAINDLCLLAVTVNEVIVYERPVPPQIRGGIVMLGWAIRKNSSSL
jgi:hypothetical protein